MGHWSDVFNFYVKYKIFLSLSHPLLSCIRDQTKYICSLLINVQRHCVCLLDILEYILILYAPLNISHHSPVSQLLLLQLVVEAPLLVGEVQLLLLQVDDGLPGPMRGEHCGHVTNHSSPGPAPRTP